MIHSAEVVTKSTVKPLLKQVAIFRYLLPSFMPKYNNIYVLIYYFSFIIYSIFEFEDNRT